MLGVRFLPRKSGRNPSIEIIIRGSDELSIINYKNIVNIIKLIASRLPFYFILSPHSRNCMLFFKEDVKI